MVLSDPKRSRKVFDAVCAELDSRDWKYEKDEEKLVVRFVVVGEDFPMKVAVVVNDELQLISFLSPMPVDFPEDKRIDGAVAVSYINNKLIDGCFDYNIQTGEVVFRMTNSYLESEMGSGVFTYIVDVSLSMIEDFNDMFACLAIGQMSVEEFMEKY